MHNEEEKNGGEPMKEGCKVIAYIRMEGMQKKVEPPIIFYYDADKVSYD